MFLVVISFCILFISFCSFYDFIWKCSMLVMWVIIRIKAVIFFRVVFRDFIGVYYEVVIFVMSF